MRKLIIVIALLACIPAFSQTAPTASEKEAAVLKKYRQLDAELKDGVYRNRYFGLVYKLPANWVGNDEDTKKRLIEMGSEKMNGSDKPAQDVGPEQGFFLLLLTSPDESLIPQISLMAQDVVLVPQIKTGADFIQLLIQQFQANPKFSVTKPSTLVKVGDQEFYEADFSNDVAYQSAVFTVIRRHAVGFIITGRSEEERKAALDSVMALQFEKPTTIYQ